MLLRNIQLNAVNCKTSIRVAVDRFETAKPPFWASQVQDYNLLVVLDAPYIQRGSRLHLHSMMSDVEKGCSF